MKILFLPNFEVLNLAYDDPKILNANKFIDSKNYWFFKYWPNTEVKIIDSKSLFPFSIIENKLKIMIIQQIKAFLKNNDFDMIMSHSYNSGFLLSLFRTCWGNHLPPHVVVDIGCFNGSRDVPFQVKILKYATKSLSGIVFHSKIHETFYEKYFDSIPRAFVPYGEDPEFYKPLSSEPTENYVLSFGYPKQRDYETLIKVWQKNKINMPLLIVGKNDFKNSLTGQITTYPKINIWMLKKIIHNSKFVILPIENAPYSLGNTSLVSSMLMEKAIIVNQVPGIIDYVDDGKNALFTKYKSEHDLLKNVEYLIDNPSEAKKIAKNARNTALNNFTDKKMSEKIYLFSKTVCGNAS